jgi:hypothetical protein
VTKGGRSDKTILLLCGGKVAADIAVDIMMGKMALTKRTALVMHAARVLTCAVPVFGMSYGICSLSFPP